MSMSAHAKAVSAKPLGLALVQTCNLPGAAGLAMHPLAYAGTDFQLLLLSGRGDLATAGGMLTSIKAGLLKANREHHGRTTSFCSSCP